MTLNEHVRLAAVSALEKKAVDLVILDLRNLSDVTDFFIICSGGSDRQLNAISDSIERTLRDHKTRPIHIEGRRGSDWILMDYFSFVVHIFKEEAREYYRLESLWGDAPKMALDELATQ